MKITIAAAFAALALGAVVASCGSGGNVATSSSTPAPQATPSVACTPPPNTQVQVVYPQPLASGVSTAPGTIIIAVAPAALQANSNLYVRVFSGSDIKSGTFIGQAFGTVLTQIPSESVPKEALNPPFALPIYESSFFGGTFGAGDTFEVYLGNGNCFPGIDLLSSFST